jgi:hypothetical protein
MSFVQGPVPDHRYPNEIRLVYDDPKGSYRPFRNRGEGNMEGKSPLFENTSRFPGFFNTFLRKVDPRKAGR